jgi:hypothetical protein
MGQVDVKGKMKNMEVIEGGMYRLQLPDDTYIYSPVVRIRPFVQRFMYKKYESGTKTYVKTLMSDNINLDLKDTAGTLNCGRPSGYIADYKSLPKETQDSDEVHQACACYLWGSRDARASECPRRVD